MIPRETVKAEAERLKSLFAQKKALEKQKGNNFTQDNIAKLGHWTQPNVSAYLRGIVELKEEAAMVFSEALGMPVSAFSPRLAARISEREMFASNPQLAGTKVRYVPTISASDLDSIKHHLKSPDFIMPTTSKATPICRELPDSAFGYVVPDNALSAYPEGSTVILNPLLKAAPEDTVLVGNKNRKNDYHFRKYSVTEILEDGTECYELLATNPAFPTLRENYEVLAVVVAVMTFVK